MDIKMHGTTIKKTHFPIEAFRILVGGECREIVRYVLVNFHAVLCNVPMRFSVVITQNIKCHTEGRRGVNQTCLRNDIYEGINKSHGARVSHKNACKHL